MEIKNHKRNQSQERFKKLVAQLKAPPVSRQFWLISIPLTGMLAWVILHTQFDEGLTLGGLWAMFQGAAVLGRLAWGWSIHKVILIGAAGLVFMRLFIEMVVNILPPL